MIAYWIALIPKSAVTPKFEVADVWFVSSPKGYDMGRKREKQKRIGKKEWKEVSVFLSKIKAYRIYWEDRNQRETRFNDRLADHLSQSLEVRSRGTVPQIKFANETYRPDLYLQKGKTKKLCTVECKLLKDSKGAKSRFKEGLSQAIVYTSEYKYVVLLLLDFTKGSSYVLKFGRGNKLESKLSAMLREKLNVHIIVLKPLMRKPS